jgi:hypothetical protein
MKLIEGAKTGGMRSIDLTGYSDIVNANIQARERAKRIAEAQAYARQMQQQARDVLKPSNIAKETGRTIWQGAKEMGKSIVGTTAAVGADVLNIIKEPFGGKRTESVNVFGNQYLTPSQRGVRAGEHFKKGEYKEGAGELLEGTLDVISTFYAPAKGLKILKGGKLLNGALQGAQTAGIYGAGYGTASGLQQGLDTKGVVGEGFKGAAIGTGAGLTLGLGTGMIGKTFSKKQTFKSNPKELVKIVGEKKPIDAFVASRPDLIIDKVKTLGKDLDGNKIQSRLEWDYKNNKGVLLMTPEAKDINLYHELGHYIDKKYPELIEKNVSEIKAVSGGKQNLNEDFAYTVAKLFYDEDARSKAQNLVKDLENVVKLELPELSAQNKETPIKQIIENEFDEAVNKTEGIYTPKEKKQLYEKHIKPKIEKLGEVKEGEVVVFFQGDGKKGQYVNTSPNQIWHYNVNENLNVKKIKETLLKKTGTKEKDAVGYRIITKDISPSKPKTSKARIVKEAPTSIKNQAQKTYTKQRKTGLSKQEAEKKAVAKIQSYEKKVEKIAKDVPIIDRLISSRKLRGTTPRKKVKTDGINWDTVNTSENTEAILKQIYKDNDQFKSVRPSRTNQDIIEGARAVGIDVGNEAQLDALLKNMPNANTALKLKQSMIDSANDLMNYLKTIDTGTATAEQLNKVKDKFLRTQSIAKAFSGLRTESSHLLRSMGIEVREGENMAEMAVKLKELLGESADTSAFIKKSQEIINPTKLDTVQAIWYNSILSGWKTWTRNILDTTNSFIAETISKGANPATLLEVPRFIAGLIKGFPKSLIRAGRVLIGSEQFSNKMEYTKRVAPYFKNKHLNFWMTEVSGRMLSAQDVVFHSTAESALDMINTFAKQMKKAGIDERTALELNEAMNKQLADRIVYRNKPMGVIGAVSSGISRMTEKVKALKFIVPFTRVVANVTDRKIDYLPILNIGRTFGKKYLSKEADIILKNTNIPPSKYDVLRPIITKRLRDQQLGRFYLGTLFSVGAYGLASNGRLSGAGPSNTNERKQLQETGWRPYSVKIGDTWVPYSYFGPLSGILAGAGSINDAVKYNKKDEKLTTLVGNGLFGFAQNLMTNSFLQGVGDMFEVLSGRGLKPADYIRNLSIGLVPIPAMWTQTVQALDGKSYDIQTIGELIKWKLGLTEGLTPRLNALGEEIMSDLIYGITPAKDRRAIQKKLTDRGLKVNVPSKTTKLGDKEMTREELFRFTKLRGEFIKENVDIVLKRIDRLKTQEEKEKAWRKFIDDAGDNTKKKMMVR